jgi:hypothetical protein
LQVNSVPEICEFNDSKDGWATGRDLREAASTFSERLFAELVQAARESLIADGRAKRFETIYLPGHPFRKPV